MINNEYRVIGVMSGTSLDGIDLVYVRFNFNTSWQFKIECFETVKYSNEWLVILRKLVTYSKEELRVVDNKYTLFLSEVILKFIHKNNLKKIDAICSHGHTALHQPENGLTYQIGNLDTLANKTKNKVVCDFRVQDVNLGGQGAPLVPIGDKLLFSNFHFCLNLGGFANISFEENKQRVAYDICPVNIVLNFYSQKMGFEFDDAGKIASQGETNMSLLTALNSLDFYKQSYPKSLGLEWVRDTVFPTINAYNLNVKDILRTFVEHIAIQISMSINKKVNASVLITGGGAFNTYLISRIKALTNNRIEIPSEEIINFKEAIIFGFLGVLKIREEVNCLSSVTGAKHNHSSGEIYLPKIQEK